MYDAWHWINALNKQYLWPPSEGFSEPYSSPNWLESQIPLTICFCMASVEEWSLPFKNNFKTFLIQLNTFFKWKQIRRLFCDTRKLHEIPISASRPFTSVSSAAAFALRRQHWGVAETTWRPFSVARPLTIGAASFPVAVLCALENAEQQRWSAPTGCPWHSLPTCDSQRRQYLQIPGVENYPQSQTTAIWPTKPKIFTIWPFVEKLCQFLSKTPSLHIWWTVMEGREMCRAQIYPARQRQSRDCRNGFLICTLSLRSFYDMTQPPG